METPVADRGRPLGGSRGRFCQWRVTGCGSLDRFLGRITRMWEVLEFTLLDLG